MADDEDCAGIALEVGFQPFHRRKIEVVGGLVQNEDVRLLQQQLCQPQAGQLAAGQDCDVLGPGILREAHAGQHLFDVDVHIVSIGCVDDVLQCIVLLQQRGILRRSRHPALQDLHLCHGIQHMGEAGAHLAVDIQRGVQLRVLFQIPKDDAMGHTELALIVGIFPGQDLQKGGLACTVLAHDADAVLPLDAGRDIMQDDLLAEGLSQFFQMYQHCCSSNLFVPTCRTAQELRADGGGSSARHWPALPAP